MTPRHHTNRSKGFTVVELMMSLAVLAVGISGIISMQKVTATSNLHSKSVAIATQIANAWQDQLLTDGTLWRSSSPVANPAISWLLNNTNGTWFRPAENAVREFGAAFDALGNPLPDGRDAQTQFCVHLQMIPLVVNGAGPGNDMRRVTIRVMWPRVQSDRTGATGFCAVAANVAEIGLDTNNFHSLYQTVAVRIHP